jgi:hypothetical protein
MSLYPYRVYASCLDKCILARMWLPCLGLLMPSSRFRTRHCTTLYYRLPRVPAELLLGLLAHTTPVLQLFLRSLNILFWRRGRVLHQLHSARALSQARQRLSMHLSC